MSTIYIIAAVAIVITILMVGLGIYLGVTMRKCDFDFDDEYRVAHDRNNEGV